MSPEPRGSHVSPWRRPAAIARLLPTLLLLCQAAPQAAQDVPSSGDRLAERLQALQQEAAALAAQSRTLLGDVRKLEVERDLRTLEAQKSEAAAADARRRAEDISQRITTLESVQARQTPILRRHLVDLYKRGRRGGWAQLMTAGGGRELARAARAAEALAFRRQRVIDDFRRDVAELSAQRKALDTQAALLRAQQTRAAEARAEAERAVAARSALLDDIDSRRDLAAQYLGELQQAQARLAADMAARSESAGAAAAVPIAPFRGMLEWPVLGRVASRFGQGGSTAGPASNGIAIAAPAGASVRVVHDGTVDYAEGFTGLGTLVIVNHGGNTFSLYGYLSEALVRRGQRVQAGTEIGRVGSPPTGSGAALYFELRVDGGLVDPVEWLKAR